MSPAITVLRTNSAVVAMRMLVLIATVVLPALGVYLSRLGMSLKPIVFMAGFFDIIVGPQLAFHLGQALGAIPKRDLTGTFGSSRPHAGWAEQEDALGADRGRFLDPVAVFGPNADRDLVSHRRSAGGASPFGSAPVAAMAIIPPAGSAIVARYASAAAASLRARLRSSRIIAPARQAAFPAPNAAVSPDARDFWLYRPPVLIALVLMLVIVASVYFVRGSAWAGTIAARWRDPVGEIIGGRVPAGAARAPGRPAAR